MVVGAYKEQIMNSLKSYDIKFVEQNEQKGTADAVKHALSHVEDEDVIILCGDTPLLSSQTLRTLIEKYKNSNDDFLILTAILREPRSYGRILRDIDGKIIKVVEYKDATDSIKKIKEVNAGVYVTHSSILSQFLPRIKPSSITGEYYLPEIIWELYKEGKRTDGLLLDDSDEMLGINTREDLVEVGRILKERIIKKHLMNGVTIKDPLNTYIEVDVIIGKDTIINPFTYLEGKTVVGERCVLGPFVWLRDAVIEDEKEIGWHGLDGACS